MAVAGEELPDLPWFVTLMFDPDTGYWTLDIGCLTHYEAKGLLASALRELEDNDPPMRLQMGGVPYTGYEDDDTEDEEEEEGS